MAKPNIDDVFAVFQDYMDAQRKVLTGPSSGWTSGFQKLQKEFRQQLDKMSLAEHIDWTENSEK